MIEGKPAHPVSTSGIVSARSDAPAVEPSRWRIVLSVLISLVIVGLLYRHRHWLTEAVGLARSAQPRWLLAALGLTLLSYLVSSQVFQVVLRSLGHRLGVGRLWATAITAIVISQSIPAGGVGSYAFLMSAFKRRGVPAGESALLAALEALSYAGAMLLIGAFSVVYVLSRSLVGSAALDGVLLGGLVALACLGGAAFVVTRSATTITRWLLLLHRAGSRLIGRPLDDSRVHTLVAELVRARDLIVTRRRLIVMLVLIQLLALSGHSLALLLVLRSLGVVVSFAVVLAAFGVALITSTFNVLPGGGGTVETMLVAVLLQLSVGRAAVPAAILFRLLNFWALLPVAGGGYIWLMRRRPLAPTINPPRV